MRHSAGFSPDFAPAHVAGDSTRRCVRVNSGNQLDNAADEVGGESSGRA
ncbi:hypothetical protein [Saccharomonospora xinjiangensis]